MPDNKIKVVHVNTFQTGGAGIASIRLHKYLLQIGIDSHYICSDLSIDTIPNCTKLSFPKYSLIQKLAYKTGLPLSPEQIREKYITKFTINAELFSTPFSEFGLENNNQIAEADIIHLHWVSNFIDYEKFFSSIKKPVVWTFHDMNPFLGCFHYQTDAQKNPQVEHISKRYEEIKRAAISKFLYPLHIIAPSNWMKENVLKTKVFENRPISVIPNGISSKEFHYEDKLRAREVLGIDHRSLMLITLSENVTNERKAFEKILELAQSDELPENVIIYAIGQQQSIIKNKKIKYTGLINDTNHLNLLLSSADFMLMPSKDDNLPNVIVEALLSGTPVIANNRGGMVEMIHSSKNGYIVNDFKIHDVVKILQVYQEKKIPFNRYDVYLKAFEKYDIKITTDKHLEIYSKLLTADAKL